MWFSGLPLLRLAIALQMFRDIASRKNSQTALTFPAEIPPACSLISSFGLKGRPLFFGAAGLYFPLAAKRRPKGTLEMKKVVQFLKKELMLTLSVLAAAIALVVTPPTPQLIRDIDWRTLGTLLMMLCVLEGFKQENILRPVVGVARRGLG